MIKTVPLRQFVRDNREAIDYLIGKATRRPGASFTELERIVWVREDYKVNKWAKRKGMA